MPFLAEVRSIRFGSSGDRDSPWLERGLEAVLVVMSVLLALGLNSWRERRQHDAVARKALHALRVEIEANRKQVNDRLASPLGRMAALERCYDDLVRSTSQAVCAASLTTGGKAEGQDRRGPILNDFIGVKSALADQYDRTLETIGDGSDDRSVEAGTGR